MDDHTPARLTRWQINGALPIDHPAQDDLAWAADEIMTLRNKLEVVRFYIKRTPIGWPTFIAYTPQAKDWFDANGKAR